MRGLTIGVTLGVGMLLLAGCGPKKEELPPLEPVDTAAATMTETPAPEPPPLPPGPRAKPVATPRPPVPTPTVTDTPGAVPATYTVQKGEGLMAIARKFYGNPARWRDIYEANRDKIANPDQIREGLVLTLPPK